MAARICLVNVSKESEWSVADTLVLYAMKCSDGYIRFVDGGHTLVPISKASVYPDLDELKAAVSLNQPDIEYRIVELTITEREL
jgi:hypothetical protein